MIREPARVTVSAEMDSMSLIKMSCQGDPHIADYQTDSLVYNTETVSVPRHFTCKVSSHVNHDNLTIISTTGSGGMFQKAPGKFLQNELPKDKTLKFGFINIRSLSSKALLINDS